MRQVTLHAAEASLPALIEAALRGEEVVIAEDGKPLVRLVPVSRGTFLIGLLKDKLGSGPDFFQPMADADLESWEGEA